MEIPSVVGNCEDDTPALPRIDDSYELPPFEIVPEMDLRDISLPILSIRARERVMSKILEAYHTENIMSFHTKLEAPYIEFYKNQQAKKTEKKGRKWVLCTVRPKQDVHWLVFLKAVRKCMSKKWLTTYTLAFEQSSSDPLNIYGFHIHLLFNRGEKQPSACEKEIRNTFSDICGDAGCDFKGISNLDLPKVLNYICGNKADADKLDAVAVNKAWRVAHKMLPCYTFDEYDKLIDII